MDIKKWMPRHDLIAMMAPFLCVASVAGEEWGPYSGGGTVGGPPTHGPILAEIRAVDASREVVLSRKFILMRESAEGKVEIEMLEPGTLEHEDHAQIRIQLLEGEDHFFEVLGRRVERTDPGDRLRLPVTTVSVKVRNGMIFTKEARHSMAEEGARIGRSPAER